MKKLLVMNFFPAFYPPSSGGELRYYNLYNELSKYYDITLLSPTYEKSDFEIVEFNENFREYRVPKEDVHINVHMEVASHKLAPEISALVCALSSDYPNRYHEVYLQLYKNVDMIVHESPYMLHYDIFFGIDKKPRIYNSYNVEYDMLSSYWSGEKKDYYLNYVGGLEERLVKKSDLCFAVSEEDKQKFIDLYNPNPDKLMIVPNGINLSELEKVDRSLSHKTQKPKVLFFGSYHPPNIEAVEYIINQIAPTLPDFEFIIAGSCSAGINTKPPNNVRLLGKVSHEEKIMLFSESTVAINPMFSGGGTNIKMIEYLSTGIPCITTPTGARGLGIIDGEHAIIAEKDEFVEALKKVVGDKNLAQKLSEKGKAFATENYGWKGIAEKTKDYIQQAFEYKHRDGKNTIVVLNDFPVDEAFNGGEIRINRLYSAVQNYQKVCLICFSKDSKIGVKNIQEDFVQISIPKTKTHKSMQTNLSWDVSADDIVNSIQAPHNRMLKDVYETSTTFAEAVVLSHPYMVSLIDDSNKKPIIYESHNTEIPLKKILLKGHPQYDFLIQNVEEVETKAVNISQLIISVSEEDKDKFITMGVSPEKIHIVNNGTDVLPIQDYGHIKKIFNDHPFIVFVGSAHYPNVEAANFIVEQLAPELRDCVFGIIGGVCDAILGKDTENIILFGKVSQEYKDILVSIADVAINPVIHGSGSNLKLADYMSKGVPIVTTSFGVRGYEVENNRHCIIAERENFASSIKALVDNQEFRKYLSKNAYTYAKQNLDWNILGQMYSSIIDEFVISKKGRDNQKTSTRLLFDVSNINLEDLNTGIQRVIKCELQNIKDITADINLQPVRMARKEANIILKEANVYSHRVGLRNRPIDDRPIYDFKDGDVYYNPDWNPDLTFEAYKKGLFHRLKNRGVSIYFMVYDILPIQMPKHFPPWQKEKHERWVEIISKVADGLVCISNTVKNDLIGYLKEKNLLRDNLRIEAVTLGADIPMIEMEIDEERYIDIIQNIKSRPTFLMVGTIEPRKGHYQVISGFELLWKDGYDVNLLIVGKEGWKGADDFTRKDIIKAVNKIKQSREYGRRLIWLENASDDLLNLSYRFSTAAIVASEGEGFGLPAVEASFYGLPVIARDIPVFREVCSDGAFFFENSNDPVVIKNTIIDWLGLYQRGEHKRSTGIKVKTWREHTQELLNFLGLK